MVINPFDKVEKKKEVEDIDIKELQKYLVDNHLQLFLDEDMISLKNKIREKLYDKYSITDNDKIQNLTTQVINNMFGYGLLQKYIDNSNVTDIRVVSFDSIYIKELGKWKKENLSFSSEDEFVEYIRYVALKNGKTINFDTPLIVFSDKKNNLRIEAGIPPVNVISPSLVIRIHRTELPRTLENLRDEYSMFNNEIYDFLLKAIDEGKNIVISGKGGSGKTTLLRAIIEKLPENMAISTNEETAELNIKSKNVIQREVMTKRGLSEEIGLDTLTKHSLVSSNDAIIIGELKGKEASVFFDSISTGHLGYATVHSDAAENTIDRLVTLIKRDIASQQYKEEFIQKLLSKSIDYIIYMKNFKISQVAKVKFERNTIKYEYLYKEEVV